MQALLSYAKKLEPLPERFRDLDRTAFTLNDTCESAAACNAATGNTCPDCIEGQCIAGQPFSCNGGQLVPAAACAPGLNCVGAGLCRCTAGTTRCAGGDLEEPGHFDGGVEADPHGSLDGGE